MRLPLRDLFQLTPMEDETMSQAPLRVAVLGMGWWSDVLADAMQALQPDRDRGLLHALGGQAAGIRGEIRLPRRPQATRRS